MIKKLISFIFIILYIWISFAESADTQWWEKESNFDKLLNNPFVVFLWKLVLAFVVVVVLIILSKIISSSIKKSIIKKSIVWDEEYVDKIWNLIWDVVFYTLLIFDIVIWFQIIWFDLWLLLWWLSFWLWFAFKEILWNMISGILILTTKDYTLWDLIKIEWINWNPWYFGYIEEITIRYTVIREFNNQKVIIPNLTFITSPIMPLTTEEYIRLETIVSVHYNSDIEKIRKLIIETVNKEKFVVNKQHTNVITEKFAESWIQLKIWFYIDPNDEVWPLEAISHVNDLIKEEFSKNDIVIPYPHTTVTVDKNDQSLLKTLLFMKK